MRPVQLWARRKRIHYFLPFIKPGDRVLEAGSGEGWFRRAVEASVPVDYTTVDIDAPADIRGDIRDWRKHGLEPGSFNVIVAFEIIEHTDCFRDSHELLKPGGLMLITTPMPHADWLLKVLEALHLTQKRTSPHANLVYLRNVPGFLQESLVTPFGIGQWAVFRKPIL
jgi:cyclopropane fatty-acyl-phospholipid synthase-like methyltransferase